MRHSILSLPLLLCMIPGFAEIEPRIIGGTPVTAGDWPFTVALLDRDTAENHSPASDANYEAFYCGGSLIAADWVLTAAHCVDPSIGAPYLPQDILILEGTTTLASGGTRRAISRIVRHFAYNSDEINRDLALLKLGEPASSPSIDILAAVAPLGSDPNDPNATVVGWGDTDNSSDRDLPHVLQQIDVPIISQSVCEDAYESGLLPDFLQIDITSNMLCAGFADIEKDSCQGDSGGPLMVLNPDNSGTHVQVGVVSFGEGCAIDDSYGVYTRLSVFADWANDFKDGIRTLDQAPKIVAGTGTFRISPLSPINDRVTKIIVDDSNNTSFDFDILDGDDISFRINDDGEIKVQGPLLPGQEYELYIMVSDGQDSMDVGKVTIKADKLSSGSVGFWFLTSLIGLGITRQLARKIQSESRENRDN